MDQLHRVMTAVDYSEAARAAFDRALALSRAHHAELTVVHAVPTERGFEWNALQRIALMASLRRAADVAGVRLGVTVQQGDPSAVILLHARSRRPDLIVLGTNERLGFERFRLGSVAETVAMRATQPVLIVPASDATGAVRPSFKSILVAVDFNAGSVAAVEHALAMANADTRVTLLHVVPGVAPAAASRYMYRLMEPEYQRHLARDAWRRIQNLIPVNAKTKVRARIATGGAAHEIARVANDVSADLILVGVTPRGAVGRRIFGSTAGRVIRTAGRSVLAVPPRAGQTAREGVRSAA